jgi:hypothetical protein
VRTQRPELLQPFLKLGPLLRRKVAMIQAVLNARNVVVDGLQLLSQGIAESSHDSLP